MYEQRFIYRDFHLRFLATFFQTYIYIFLTKSVRLNDNAYVLQKNQQFLLYLFLLFKLPQIFKRLMSLFLLQKIKKKSYLQVK